MTIDCFAGRSVAAKRELYREITGRLAAFDIPADHITILLRESALENWASAVGRRPAT
ncbi:tautomerase family protein [Mycolicibacterium sp. CBMA 226]|uniref:tautomerase family protein n=1 Tax=Mycolicibacterium sp. CBMA 226 TaxID=2606611 RepID=UPI0037C55312